MDMTRKRLLVKGQKVHDVGYRPFLLGLAESLEIERFFADNIFIEGKQAVYALIDSSGEKVKAFIEIASSKFPENSDVKKVEEEDYTGNVMKTESYYRYLTAMQLSRIATYGGNMLEKQDKMLEKQDSLMGITQKGFDEMKTGFREVKEEVGKGSAEVKNEIHLLRDDFRELFMREVNELRSEILVLKETVARIEKAIASG
jgi:acylphosphatase